MRALAAGCGGSSECGAWATGWRHPGRPRFAGCPPPHGPAPARLRAAVPPVQRWQRQAPPHAGKGWAGLQQKNAWPSSLAGRTEHANAEICREAPSRHAGNAPAKGAWPVRTAQMQRSGKTGEPPAPPWPKRPKLPQWAHRYNRGWEGRGRGLHKATHGPGAGVRRPGRQQPSRLAGFHCNNWHFPRWGSGNEGARLLRCNIGWSTCFLGLPGDEAGVSPRTGDAVAGYGSWPWRPPQCGFPRPAWQTRVPGAF